MSRNSYRKARMKRVIVLGLDGMDPELAARWIRLGKLPHLARLARRGTFRPLATTLPPVSPAAWSTFLTGVHPGKHNVFDILCRDRHTYRPFLSGARVLGPQHRPFPGLALRAPEVKALRKSKPFWHYLGDSGIFSSVIRVPGTFPPEPFAGVLLSGLGVPDLRGTQGTYSLFTTREVGSGRQEGGVVLPLEQEGANWRGELPGPENPLSKNEPVDLTAPFTLRLEPAGSAGAGRLAVLAVDGQRIELRHGKFSDWTAIHFRAGWRAPIYGICRFYLKSLQPEVELYASPVQVDPARPALTIGHPPEYSAYLAKLCGPFATLGQAEDAWAVDQGVLDESIFLEWCHQIHAEREQMFFDALEKSPRGLCICVFDIIDRVQHLFWRQVEPPRTAAAEPPEASVIELLYQRMDALVGRVLEAAGSDALVMVVSAHGFKAFHRSFNLNSWLYHNGYLALVSGSTVSEDRFRQVDWQRTRAFGLGWNGLYLNLAGRERHGAVQPGEEADHLLDELRGRLRGITDPGTGQTAIREVYGARQSYAGPYTENAPDLIVGYAPGYNAAWESVNGAVMGRVFQANVHAWSGAHTMDPRDVPGVLFANRTILGDRPSIADVAPTILQLFGLPVPHHMDGHAWTVRTDPPPPRPPGPTPGPL